MIDGAKDGTPSAFSVMRAQSGGGFRELEILTQIA